MKSLFESMGGTYTQSGDYFIPDIALPKTSNRKIGKYGRMRHRYLKEHRPVIYSTMILNGTLWDHLAEIDLTCNNRLDVLISGMQEKQGITEELIATLAEDIEELRSEKAMLLRSLDCADDAVMGDVKKDIAAMEAALKKLDEQEIKYAAELESQAVEFDAEELGDARLNLRPGMDRSTVSRIQTAYDTQYSPFIMAEVRRHISQMLDEHDEESCSIRERLRNHQQAQSDSRGKEKDINR